MKELIGSKKKQGTAMLAGAFGLLLALTLIVALVAAPAMAVDGFPQLTHRFFGEVTYEASGLYVEEGARVSAEVYDPAIADWVEVAFDWVVLEDDIAWYDFYVPYDDDETAEKDGGEPGDEIRFYVDGVLAGIWGDDLGEPGWESGGSDRLDLEVLGDTYDLTVISEGCCPITVEGFGTVDANDTDTFQVPVDTDVTVTADDSNPSCEFDSWSDGGDISHSVHMDDNKSVTAYCSITGPTYDLTVTSDGCCPITVEGLGTVDANDTDTFQVPVDTDVTVTADDSYAYCQFDSWSDAGARSHSVHMDGDKSVTAYCSTIGVIPGDADEDGEVTVLDITKVAMIILEKEEETPGADANEDGVVNVLDITEIARIILGLD